MEDTPEAPTTAPAEASVANQQISNESAQPAEQPAEQSAIDMHGFSQEDLAGMRRFIDNNGGWDAIKQKISTPKSYQQPEQQVDLQEQQQMQQTQPTSQPVQQQQYSPPKGAITASEFLAEQYFKSLAGEEKYANISEGVRNGDYLKEMSQFGIQPLNPDGSINDNKVRMYLDLKAQTVPAKPTEAEPNASAAPTVSYTEVGEKISDINQAYKVLMEPGNPGAQKAEEFIKNFLNKK